MTTLASNLVVNSFVTTNENNLIWRIVGFDNDYVIVSLDDSQETKKFHYWDLIPLYQ
jgi:hypothetical protein